MKLLPAAGSFTLNRSKVHSCYVRYAWELASCGDVVLITLCRAECKKLRLEPTTLASQPKQDRNFCPLVDHTCRLGDGDKEEAFLSPPPPVVWTPWSMNTLGLSQEWSLFSAARLHSHQTSKQSHSGIHCLLGVQAHAHTHTQAMVTAVHSPSARMTKILLLLPSYYHIKALSVYSGAAEAHLCVSQRCSSSNYHPNRLSVIQ